MDRFDIFPKTYDDFKERTLGGAVISIVCCLFALLLFAAEFAQYRAVETVDMLDVDTSTAGNTKLSINVDVLLPSLKGRRSNQTRCVDAATVVSI